jgi:hypothetical protein
MYCDSFTEAVMAIRILNCQLCVKTCSAELHENHTKGLVADTRLRTAELHENQKKGLLADIRLRTNGHDLHVWRCSLQRFKTNMKITIKCVTSVRTKNSARAERMVVCVTKTTAAVYVAITVIFNFSATVAMFTKAAIDFLVTVVTNVTTVTKVSMVTFAILITKATILRW